ncbi:copper chaperone PCu(A)C [Pseudonocardia oceani]|uniref:Copper(I)-binding protein n=1 Tax=Pseudonocardia oceani TaxID=2792013 RepID=A0ABS6UBA5_9PSEU|nr:copper chaperone PCu(A)C [Pseudonocardia oceani]MBW0129253.1 hypothetical protein [Pseudonocardia oceani]
MSRTARTHRTAAPARSGLLAGVLVGALALTGCGAGQIAGTAEQVAAVNGSNAVVGAIAVRDAVIVYGEQPVQNGVVYTRGSDAPLNLFIINEGEEADTLVSASSPWASSVTIAGVTEIPAGRSIAVEGEIAAEESPATGTRSPSAAPTTSPAPTSAAATGAPSGAPAPPESGAEAEGTQIVLTGLLDDIRAGVSYDVTLVFERAGEVTVNVPVGATEEPREDEPGA